MKKNIIVGSRESQLAIVQSEIMINQIREIYPDANVGLITMKTTGDKILDKALDEIGGKGLFIKELDQALREGRIDLAVHSLKDMPAEEDDDLPVLAYSKRENPADALILPAGTDPNDIRGPVGSSSARRKIQFEALYPGTSFESVRGNVRTRLKKLEEGCFGALILAYAGLIRLDLHGLATKIFSPDEMIPSAGQGILAVQGRKGEYRELTEHLSDASSERAAAAERAFVRALGCGCTAPVAAYAETNGRVINLRAMYFDENIKIKVTGSDSAALDEAEKLGTELADKLLTQLNSAR